MLEIGKDMNEVETTSEPEKGEVDKGTNNFYMNLPGGWHREINQSNAELANQAGEKHRCNRLRLFSAIDILLANEFATIDVKAVFTLIAEVNETLYITLKDTYIDDFVREAFIKLNKRRLMSVDKILEPLFKRLLEIGFERNLLLS